MLNVTYKHHQYRAHLPFLVLVSGRLYVPVQESRTQPDPALPGTSHPPSFETRLWCWMNPSIVRYLISQHPGSPHHSLPSLASHLFLAKPLSCCCLHPTLSLCREPKGQLDPYIPLLCLPWQRGRSKSRPCPMAQGPAREGFPRLSLGRGFLNRLWHIPAQSSITRDDTTPSSSKIPRVSFIRGAMSPPRH